MGIGYTVIVSQDDIAKALDVLKTRCPAYHIGNVIEDAHVPIYLKG